MALTGAAGFDLYISVNHQYVFVNSFVPPDNMSNGYTSCITINKNEWGAGVHFYMIDFPLYNSVKEVCVGVSNDCILEPGESYEPSEPIVYYGSSITQGACATRQGNSYQGFISRRLNMDFINLGFLGCARGEESMAAYIAGLSMSAFVCDYDHNARSSVDLAATHYKMYDIIRERHPNLPYIMVSKPDVIGKRKRCRYAP